MLLLEYQYDNVMHRNYILVEVGCTEVRMRSAAPVVMMLAIISFLHTLIGTRMAKIETETLAMLIISTSSQRANV
jgi:hypothetical protein